MLRFAAKNQRAAGSVKRSPQGGFTLVEMLVVIAVITILAALLLPTFSSAKARTKQTACLNNLRQINLGVRMYADDYADTLPAVGGTTNYVQDFSGYKQLMRNHVGLHGASSPRDKVFACPVDTFYYEFSHSDQRFNPRSVHNESRYDFSSYWLNAGTVTPFRTNSLGLGSRKFGTIKNPARTILVAEMSAFFPWSWHRAKRPLPRGHEWPIFKDARNMVSFMDGHGSYLKIYWDMSVSRTPCPDPPAGYDYQWSGN